MNGIETFIRFAWKKHEQRSEKVIYEYGRHTHPGLRRKGECASVKPAQFV